MKVRVGAMNGKRLDYFKGALDISFARGTAPIDAIFHQANLRLKPFFHLLSPKLKAYQK